MRGATQRRGGENHQVIINQTVGLGTTETGPSTKQRTGIKRDSINEEQRDAATIHRNALKRTDSEPSPFQCLHPQSLR